MTPANDFTKTIISRKIKIAILDFSKMTFPDISKWIQKWHQIHFRKDEK